MLNTRNARWEEAPQIADALKALVNGEAKGIVIAGPDQSDPLNMTVGLTIKHGAFRCAIVVPYTSFVVPKEVPNES